MGLTDGNPILKDFAWTPKKVLIDCTNSKGQKLQGTLTLPVEYEQGKRSPMIVTFYEIVSSTHHNFSVPGYGNSPQPSMYSSNGYLVFQPDMVYEVGKPGTSAVDCMTAAVKKVIELGYADPKRIGLHGHSFGNALADDAIARHCYPNLALTHLSSPALIGSDASCECMASSSS